MAYNAVEIIPGRLDLGAFPNHIDAKYTHVLNMTPTANPPESHPYIADGSKILNIPILDIDDITPHLPLILSFLDEARANGYVLVHCALGINRSASAVIAYLCHTNNYDTTRALRELKARKPNVQPSIIFLNQIDTYFGHTSIKADPMAGFHERLRLRKLGGVSKQVEASATPLSVNFHGQ